MQIYRLTRDVTGAAYELLLRAGLGEAATFSLVWRDQLQFSDTAVALRDALRTLQLRHAKRDRWPGTILLGHYASVITYRAAPEALPTLLRPDSLFAWRAPAYPEDLSFCTDQDRVVLATVTHESRAWILSSTLASAIGQLVTLIPETLQPGDEKYFQAEPTA
jgi:hypothetical protein